MNKKKIGYIVLGIIVVLGAFFIGWEGRAKAINNQRETVINAAGEYIEAIIAGENEKAYALGSKGIQQEFTQEQFNANYAGTVIESPVYKWANAAELGEKYIVYSSVDGYPAKEDGSTEALFTVVMVNENGKWKIDSAIVQQVASKLRK